VFIVAFFQYESAYRRKITIIKKLATAAAIAGIIFVVQFE